ncbi:MAG: GNAT family N-acetyltransferase [Burkholderiaceae bacterium]|nr:GNAT family N-acetyltransferase [Burkholderiaceae bacterium]
MSNAVMQIGAREIRLSGLGDSILLRPAVATDAPAVAELLLLSRKTFLPYLRQVHGDADVHQWVAGTLIPSQGVSLALGDKGTMLGVLALSRDEAGMAWIDQLYLHPDAILRGLGSVLLSEAMQLLGPTIRLYTFQLNTGARRFYQRHGFEVIALSDGQRNEERCPDVLFEWRDAAPDCIRAT